MNYVEKLQDLFPNHLQSTIQQVVDNVQEELTYGDENGKLDRMCTLLIENYANDNLEFELDENTVWDIDYATLQVLCAQLARRFPDACPQYIADYLKRPCVRLEYASIVQHFQLNGYIKKGGSDVATTSKNGELIRQIMELFPDACEVYINKCINEGLDLDALIDKFTDSYVKAIGNDHDSSQFESFHQRLCEMLPKFDPDFLRAEAMKLPYLTEATFSNCVAELLKMETYPTTGEYNKRQMNKKKMLDYLFHFKIDMFLKEFSNNLKCFENHKRKHSLLPGSSNPTDVELQNNQHFAFKILCYVYPHLQPAVLESKLNQFNYDILQCCNNLGKPGKRDLEESKIALPPNSYTNRLLFQELAYVMYQPLINNYLRIRNSSYEKAYKEAEAAQQLRTCSTCFEEGLLLIPEECYQCSNGCVFCKQCMIRGCEVAYGDGLLEVSCFNNCGSNFSDNTLQMVMDPIAYYKLMQRKQIKAIRDAQLDDFETCPACDYGTIVNKDDKIFICKNPDCEKESCRECHHDAHIPLRCNEIEYDEDVKMRTYIENQMSQALIRVCKKCNRQIIKEAGCNKMTCACGETMCYVCGESGISYKHFGVNCPQHSNQDELHRQNILEGIKAAKSHLGVDKDPSKLKFDPSKNF